MSPSYKKKIISILIVVIIVCFQSSDPSLTRVSSYSRRLSRSSSLSSVDTGSYSSGELADIETYSISYQVGWVNFPDSKVHEAYMGPTWGRQDPGGPHVGPMNLAIRVLNFHSFNFFEVYSTEIYFAEPKVRFRFTLSLEINGANSV